jgi:hypothetical protein
MLFSEYRYEVLYTCQCDKKAYEKSILVVINLYTYTCKSSENFPLLKM